MKKRNVHVKPKRVRKAALLIAVSLFTTQIFRIPVSAQEVYSEEVIEAEVENTLESEPDEITDAVSEPAPEADIWTEQLPEEEESVGAGEESIITPLTGTEDSTGYDEYDSPSLSGTSFTVTDVRDSSRSKLLDTDNGKQAVYLFGGIVTCGNTRGTLAALSKCIEYYNKNKLDVFAFEIQRSTSSQVASQLDSLGISEDIIVGTKEDSREAQTFYDRCFMKTVAGGFTMPLIVYKDTNGDIYTYTTSVQSVEALCSNIEKGGLKKGSGDGKFTVKFDTDGGSPIAPLEVSPDETVEEPEEPVKEGYHFAGWYLDGEVYDFGSPVTADITLRAVWKEYETLTEPTSELRSEMVLESGTRVRLTHPMSGVTIYYTTDGGSPAETGVEYRRAVIIDKETTIRAIAVRQGYKNSAEALFHYTVADRGSLWGEVQPEDIPENGIIPDGIWIAEVKDAVYTGKAVKPNIRVYDGHTLLHEKKDYTVSYKNNVKAAKKSDAKAPSVIVSGKGCYNQKRTILFNINPKNIGDSDVTADAMTVAYTGNPVKAVPVIISGSKKLSKNKDFTITNPSVFKDAKNYTIRVEGKGNYTGTRDVKLTITKKIPVSKASVMKIPDQVYDGRAKTPEIKVKLKKELSLNKDYTLLYENNKKVGNASVIVKGKGEYAGTKRVSFKIVSPYKNGKYDIGEDKEKLIDLDLVSRVEYKKGGNTPAVRVSFDGKRLVKGKDYTVSFRDYKTAYEVSGKDASAVITGKGKYCGKITKNFRIEAKDISKTTLLVNDRIYTGKPNGSIPKFSLTDTNGKRLKAGTDFEREAVYTYVNAVNLENGEIRNAGDSVKESDMVPKGTAIKITITGRGCYNKTVTGEYRVAAQENNISKAKVTLKSPQYYTGREVRPDQSQLEVKLGEKVLGGSDYSIVCYTNNIKKGNAFITIRGEGSYGGTKTAKFIIQSKTIDTIGVGEN